MTSTSRSTSMFASGNAGSTSIRQPSGHHAISQQQSSALSARIASKKAELDNLKQLRSLSCALSTQMQMLEEKISTLKGGTEAVSFVLSNWDNVLRAISMASMNPTTSRDPANENAAPEDDQNVEAVSRLPATLVRIPAEQQEEKP